MLPAHLKPRTWPTWIVLGLFRLLVFLPIDVAMKTAPFFGGLVNLLIPEKRRHIHRANIAACFPDLTRDEIDRMVKENFLSTGKGIVEIGYAWWGNREKLLHLLHIEGFEYFEAAQKKGNGVILLSAHFTPLELGGCLLAAKLPFQVLYRRSDDAAIEHVMQKGRNRNYEKAIHRDNIKEMVRALRKGHAVWFAPDQNAAARELTFAPFFGIQTSTNTATARLAKISGSPVVPLLPFRRRDGKGYDLCFGPELENFPSGDDVADAAAVNAVFENWIRKQPEDYFWFHRRFKERPEGEPSIY